MGSTPAPREACSKGSRPRARSSARSSSTRSRRRCCRMKSLRMTFPPRRSSSQPWPRRRAPPMPRSSSSHSWKRRSRSRRRWRRLRRGGAPVVPKRPGVGAPPRFGGASPKAPESPKIKPVVPKRPGPPARKPMVEVPPLELEPDFDTGATDGGHEVDDRPLAIDDAGVGRVGGGRRSGAIDLSLDGVVTQGDERGSLVFANIDAAPVKPTIEDLEGRVADDPDDPEGHKALGEALIEAGERERGIEELDLATTGFETRGNLRQAQDLVDEILRLDPNSVRHRQKQVEFAFKSGDKAKLIDAYVELADTLLRSDLPDKARAVYKRVAEHDPANE